MRIAVFLMSAWIVGLSISVWAEASENFRVADGSIVVASPFDLEIGSTAYAKAPGVKIQRDRQTYPDRRTGQMVTNRFCSASGKFDPLYLGVRSARLSFDVDDESLQRIGLSFGLDKNWKAELSYADCDRVFRGIVADLEKRFPDEVEVRGETTEAEALARLEELAKEMKEDRKRGERIGGFAAGFQSANATVTQTNGVSVDIRLSAMIHSDKKYSLDLCLERKEDRWCGSVDGVPSERTLPVYTNRPHAVNLNLRTPEQEAAHVEAAKLRGTILKIFGVDLDAPSVTNDLSASLTSFTNAPAQREWFPLEKPFAGLTERKTDQGVRFLMIPMTSFAVRKAYASADESTMKADAQEILSAFERAYGEAIPPRETSAPKTEPKSTSEPPAFGDWSAMVLSGFTEYFSGQIGDIGLSIKYAVPSYVKRNGAYEIAMRGAIVVEILQSPLLASSAKKGGQK